MIRFWHLVAIVILLTVAIAEYCFAGGFELTFKEASVTSCIELYQPKNILLAGSVNIANYRQLIFSSMGLLTPDTEKYIFIIGLGINLRTLAQMSGWEWNLSDAIICGCYYGYDFGEQKNYAGINLGFLIK